MSFTIKKVFVGEMNFPDGVCDITDPCYDVDIWCRKTKKIKPGVYECYKYVGVCARGDKERVWIARIVLKDDAIKERVFKDRSWRLIGQIGVDAGLAGFFNNKPDFSDDEWCDICDKIANVNHLLTTFDGHDGFFTDSGRGDGVYAVYAVKEKGEIVALEIRF